MCDIRSCISWPEKSQDAYRTSLQMPFGWSMCDIRFCISWPEKSQDAYRTPRPILFGWAMCDIRFCISWPEKVQDVYRTSRSMPFGWSMCDIRPCISWPEKSRCISHISPDAFRLVDVRYSVLYLLARKSQHASSHIDRFDSPVDVRYRVLYRLAKTNHNMHHRTSTDSSRLAMCDIGFCISWPENHNATHPRF